LEKLSVYDEIVIKNLKKRRDRYETNFYVNFHVKDDATGIHRLVNEMMQEGALTSFASYDLYRTKLLTKYN